MTMWNEAWRGNHLVSGHGESRRRGAHGKPTARGRVRIKPWLEALERRMCPSLLLGLSGMTGTVGTSYSGQITVTGGSPSDTYAYQALTPLGTPYSTATNLPSWLNLNSATGQLSGTPNAPGSFPLLLAVTDQTIGATAQEGFPLSIAPLITLSGGVSNGTEWTTFPTATFTANGPSGDTYTFATSGNLPPGLQLQPTGPATAQLVGTPSLWGTYAFTVTATDPGGSTGAQIYEVAIAPGFQFTPAPLANTPEPGETVFLNNLPNATFGVSYTETITAAGAQQLSSNVASYGGLTITNTAPNTLTIAGVPTGYTGYISGPLIIQATATGANAQQADVVDYQLNVEPTLASPYVAIQVQGASGATSGLPNATVNQPYSQTFTVPQSAGAGYTFALMEPSGVGPPTGLTFADGVLSGTPTLMGTFQLVVQATDSTGALNDSRVFSLTVASGANLPISPTTIPVGSLGVSYSQTFTGGTGTTLSYTIGNGTYADLQALGLQVLQSNQFPSVLSLVGTPVETLGGTSLVLNVTCTDASGNSSTQAYPIAVTYTPAEISQAYGLTGINGNGAGQTVAIIDGGDAPNLVSSNDPNFDSSDLHQFDLQFNLPDPPEFLKLDAFGGTNFPTNPPSGTSSDGQAVDTLETTQDVEWVHALAPGANIILLEGDYATAIQTARNLPGVAVVSMSFTMALDSYLPFNEAGFDPVFTSPAGHPMTFVAASGDNIDRTIDGIAAQNAVNYPATSPNVLSVGYTGLTLDAQGGYGSESAAPDAGGGASVQVPQPSYQQGVVGATGTTTRTTPDVTLNGRVITGAAVYDSYATPWSLPWVVGDGSSLSTPSWAAILAIADQGRSAVGLPPLDGASQTLPDLYNLAGSDALHPIQVVGAGESGAQTLISPAYGLYNPWGGLGSPVANVLIPWLVSGANQITGTVFADNDGTGVPDGNNPPLPGVTVYLDANQNGQLDPGETSTVTSSDGSYGFLVLPGNYAVAVVPPAGLVQAIQSPGTFNFGLGTPVRQFNVDFGLATPAPIPTPAPTPTPAPPLLLGISRAVSGQGLHRRSPRFQLLFNTPLNSASAGNPRTYLVTQTGPFRRSRPRFVKVPRAVYEASSNAVILTLGQFAPRKPLKLTINGLIGANGIPAPTIISQFRSRPGPPRR